jgi:hypothetical protein
MVCLVESVLHLEDGDVRVYLSPLNSLLEISERYNGLEGIFFHHTSFGDFLPQSRTVQRLLYRCSEMFILSLLNGCCKCSLAIVCILNLQSIQWPPCSGSTE